MSKHTLVIPDIGADEEVDVIEVLVAVGDQIEEEQSLITLESDKASMEIPASHAGEVLELLVKVGDKVKTGDAIAEVRLAEQSTKDTAQAKDSAEQDAPSKQNGASTETTEATAPTAASAAVASSQAPEDAVDLVVLGAGPGGYSAAFRAADLGLSVVIVERYSTLGGVCLNVGCIPSKALLHVTNIIDEAKALSEHGVAFGDPQIDLDKIRGWKEKVVSQLTNGLAGMAKMRKVKVVNGEGKFTGSHTLAVQNGNDVTNINFENAIIAAGSRPIKLPFIPHDDPRVWDSTDALALKDVPEKLLIMGGGIIGLEMGTVYHELGSQIDVVEMFDQVIQTADKVEVKIFTNSIE